MNVAKTSKRKQNEKKFESWTELSDGGRRYWYDVRGNSGWNARYVKEVDTEEKRLNFIRKYMMKMVSCERFMRNTRWTKVIVKSKGKSHDYA